VAEAGIAQRRVGRILATRLAVSAKSLHPDIPDALFRQRMLQRLAIKMWQATRHREGADIDQRLDAVRLQNRHEFIEGACGMADGVEGRHGKPVSGARSQVLVLRTIMMTTMMKKMPALRPGLHPAPGKLCAGRAALVLL